MSTPEQPAADLQFERAEVAAAGVTCSSCKQAISDQYFQINGAATCNNCREGVVKFLEVGFNPVDFMKAIAVGSIAAAAGALLWAIVGHFIGQWGFIAIIVGLMVGKSIQWVIQGRGGIPFQVLAVFLTYSAIAISYIIPVLSDIGSYNLVRLITFAYTLPVRGGGSSLSSILGLVILGIALYEAWIFTKRPDIQITGPYRIGGAQPPA